MKSMANEVVKIIGEVITTVEEKLPSDNISDARELLDHNEWGEALSLIYTQLYEYDVKVSRTTFDQIELAGKKMRLDSKGWEILEIED